MRRLGRILLWFFAIIGMALVVLWVIYMVTLVWRRWEWRGKRSKS
jgi:hypothetical protein